MAQNSLNFFMRRLARNRSGQVAMIFALVLIPIVAIAGFAIDFQMTTTSKNRAQVIVDSAVLAGAKAMQANKSDADVKLLVKQFIQQQMDTNGTNLSCDNPKVIIVDDTQDIDVEMTCRQETSLMNVVGQEKIDFDVRTGSTWGISKLDVAFMFDISGSMKGSRLKDLKASTNAAIDILLPENAPEAIIENTRLAMSSYNAMVDAGDFFEDATGVKPTRTYTHELSTEYNDTQEGDLLDDYVIELYDAKTNKLITEIGDDSVVYIPVSQKNKLTLTVRARPGGKYKSSQIKSVWMRLSGKKSKTKTENAFPYALYGDSKGNFKGSSFDYGKYEFEFKAYKNKNRSGYLGGEKISFELVGLNSTKTLTYTLTDTCVWERGGSAAFTADAPGEGKYFPHASAWFEENPKNKNGGEWKVGHPNLGYDYILARQYGLSCSPYGPVELTNNRTTLSNYVNSLQADGATAGHMGTAWSWYLIAPEWASLFSESAQPMPYDEPDANKAVILMTDGVYNAQLFSGQGSSFNQAKKLCDNMKAEGIIVYTVAFQAPKSGRDILNYCATGPDFYFNPKNGAQLEDAYKSIATSLSDLRIKF